MGVQQRGIADGAYVSTSRPAISVAVSGLPLKTGGFGHGMLREPSAAGPLTIDVHSYVYGRSAQGPQASVTHAELPGGWFWTTVTPRFGAIDEGMEVYDGQKYTAFTYLVPSRTDPFAGVLGEPVQTGGRETYWIARYFASVRNMMRDKIILEYREPAPANLTDLSSRPVGMENYLEQFEERARKAFSVRLPASPLAQVQSGTAYAGIRWQFMRDEFLGPVMEEDNNPDAN